MMVLIKNYVAGDGLDTGNISIKFLPPPVKRYIREKDRARRECIPQFSAR